MAVTINLNNVQGAATARTAAQWVSDNPIIPANYVGFETDTGKYKLGDGVTAWNSLSYPSFGGGTWGSITGTLSDQTDLQSALDAKAALAGAAFTGDVSVTTSGSGDTLQLTNSGSGTTLNILNSGSGDFLTIDSTKLVIDNGGDVSIGTATASARFHVLTGSTSKVGAIIQAAAGQTANLQEWRNSSGTALGVVTSGGNLIFGASSGGSQKLQIYGDSYIRGSGTTSGTNGLIVRNNTDNEAFRVRNDGFVFIGGTGFSGTGQLQNGAGLRINSTIATPFLISADGYSQQIFAITSIGTGNTLAFGQSNVSSGIHIQSFEGLNGFVAVGNRSLAGNSNRANYSGWRFSAATNYGLFEIRNGSNANYGRFAAGSTTLYGEGTTNTTQVLTLRNSSSIVAAMFDNGNLAIGSHTPNDSAILDISSTIKGFLPPRMTGAQVEAIASPAEGLIAYATNAGAGDVTAKGWWGYNGTNWIAL